MTDTYQENLEKMQKLYFSIGSIPCPALDNQRIYFNQQGFRHFLRKNGGMRPISDQLRRFQLFNKYVQSVIGSKDSCLENKESDNKMKLVGITKKIVPGYTIKVVVARMDNSSFCFVSIMDKKQK